MKDRVNDYFPRQRVVIGETLKMLNVKMDVRIVGGHFVTTST
jgi:hypothetical protein